MLKHTRLLLAGDVGFEPTHVGIKIRCLNPLGESPKKGVAGEVGIEPTYVGIKIRCLTTWRLPNASRCRDWKRRIIVFNVFSVKKNLFFLVIYLIIMDIMGGLVCCVLSSLISFQAAWFECGLRVRGCCRAKIDMRLNLSCVVLRIALTIGRLPEFLSIFLKQLVECHFVAVADCSMWDVCSVSCGVVNRVRQKFQMWKRVHLGG